MERCLYAYRQVHRSYPATVAVLAHPGQLFDGHLAGPTGTDDHSRHALRLDLGDFEIRRSVAIELGPLTSLTSRVSRLPLSWRAETHAGLFPEMTGHLEIAALAQHPPLCQLTLLGTYRPPVSLIGALGDQLAGHRIATQCLEHLLDDLVIRLEQLDLAHH